MKKKIVDLIELQQTEGFDGLFNSTEDSDERKIWGTAIAKEYGVEDSYGKNPSSTWSKVAQNSYYNYQRSRSAMDVREDSKFLKMQKDAEKSGKIGIAKGIDKARTGLRYTWKALNGDPRNDEKVMDGMRKARRKAMKDIQDVIDRTE